MGITAGSREIPGRKGLWQEATTKKKKKKKKKKMMMMIIIIIITTYSLLLMTQISYTVFTSQHHRTLTSATLTRTN